MDLFRRLSIEFTKIITDKVLSKATAPRTKDGKTLTKTVDMKDTEGLKSIFGGPVMKAPPKTPAAKKPG